MWDFNPEYSLHFGSLWEEAVKSMKTHLKHVVADVKLNFEELTTILAQIEARFNSRPLIMLLFRQFGKTFLAYIGI